MASTPTYWLSESLTHNIWGYNALLKKRASSGTSAGSGYGTTGAEGLAGRDRVMPGADGGNLDRLACGELGSGKGVDPLDVFHRLRRCETRDRVGCGEVPEGLGRAYPNLGGRYLRGRRDAHHADAYDNDGYETQTEDEDLHGAEPGTLMCRACPPNLMRRVVCVLAWANRLPSVDDLHLAFPPALVDLSCDPRYLAGLTLNHVKRTYVRIHNSKRMFDCKRRRISGLLGGGITERVFAGPHAGALHFGRTYFRCQGVPHDLQA